MAMMLGKHTIRVSSTTQGPISLASGEAELHSGGKDCSMPIGFQSIASDFGVDIKLRSHIESSAAKGIMSRRGCGKARHLETKVLWIQKAVTDKVFQLCKVEGLINPADIGTKHNDSATMLKHLSRLGYFSVSGRSRSPVTSKGDLPRFLSGGFAAAVNAAKEIEAQASARACLQRQTADFPNGL